MRAFLGTRPAPRQTAHLHSAPVPPPRRPSTRLLRERCHRPSIPNRRSRRALTIDSRRNIGGRIQLERGQDVFGAYDKLMRMHTPTATSSTRPCCSNELFVFAEQQDSDRPMPAWNAPRAVHPEKSHHHNVRSYHAPSKPLFAQMRRSRQVCSERATERLVRAISITRSAH